MPNKQAELFSSPGFSFYKELRKELTEILELMGAKDKSET